MSLRTRLRYPKHIHAHTQPLVTHSQDTNREFQMLQSQDTKTFLLLAFCLIALGSSSQAQRQTGQYGGLSSGVGSTTSNSNFGANTGSYYHQNDILIPSHNNNNNNNNNIQPDITKPLTASNSFGSTINNQIGSTNRYKDQQRPAHSQNDGAITDKHTLDRFHHRFPDGSYEFRYELDDGTSRYERGYFLLFDKIKTLVVVGYYSYRQTDGRYITVFYNADQNGYRQNQSITPQVYANLPRTIEVPQLKQSSGGYPTDKNSYVSTANQK